MSENLKETWTNDIQSTLDEQFAIEESLSWPLSLDSAKTSFLTDFSADFSELNVTKQAVSSEEPQPCCSKSLPPLPPDWFASCSQENQPNTEEKVPRRSERLKERHKKQEDIETEAKEIDVSKPKARMLGVDPLFSSKFKCSFNFGQTLFLYLSEKDDEGEKFMETIEDHVFYTKDNASVRDEFGLHLSHNEYTNAVNYIQAAPWAAFTDVLYQVARFIQWSPFVRLVLLYRCPDNLKKVVVHRMWLDRTKLSDLMKGLIQIRSEDRVGFILGAYLRRCCVKKASGHQCDFHKNIPNFFI